MQRFRRACAGLWHSKIGEASETIVPIEPATEASLAERVTATLNRVGVQAALVLPMDTPNSSVHTSAGC